MGWRRPHGNPDRNQDQILKAGRKLPQCNLVVTTGIGRGFPDLVAGFRGITVLVENKTPGGKTRDSQDEFMATWHGGPVLTVRKPMDLVDGLIHLDKITPPVRGVHEAWRGGEDRQLLAACLEAAGGLVDSPDKLPELIRILKGRR